MERDYTTKFIGLNVHSKTTSVAIADKGRTGEVRHYGTIENTTEAIEKVIGSLASTGIAHRFIYEAALVVLLCIGITGWAPTFISISYRIDFTNISITYPCWNS